MAKKKGRNDLAVLIPIGVIIIMIVVLIVWRNNDTDDSATPEILDTGQSDSLDTDSMGDDSPDEDPNEFEELPPNTEEERKLWQPPENIKITVEQIASYDGRFVEDGDVPVTDCAAILVRNDSDKYLQYAKMVYDVDENEAVFEVSGLHPGKSAWVLEKNGLKVKNDSKFVHKQTIPAYKDHAVRTPKELDIGFRDGMIMVTNKTDRPLLDVRIAYKVMHRDGNFKGGITYQITFDKLEPGASADSVAGHFDMSWAQPVEVTWREEPSDSGA